MTANNDPSEGMELMCGEGTLCSDEGHSLGEVAIAFRKGVVVSTHRHNLRTYRKMFAGSEAVTFLVDNGYAKSRPEAVTIGCQLAEMMNLFEHVLRKQQFKDAYLFYHFLILDDNMYTFTTHQPHGKSLFRILHFLDEDMNYTAN